MSKLKKIAITIGDPAGIGPEITLKAIFNREIAELCEPVIIGDRVVIEEVIRKIKIPVGTAMPKKNFDFDFIDTGTITDHTFEKCRPSLAGGAASAAYIKTAVELALNRNVDAIVTAPITKESLKMAGFQWPGHTEMLAELTGTADFAMMLCGGPLKVILVTIHTALKNVPALITKDRVLKTIVLANRACGMLGIENPRIAVAGLNPHAGESGMFGDEEIKHISPAVEEAKNMGIPVSGPYPPDTLFHKAYNGQFDVVVCMYHDQGLVALKMIALDKGVNVTVGLPIIRTSPDHGTAYDIAWQGVADASSMVEAIKMAARLSGV